ncbi:MAG: DUF1573 domain-containing protein [Bacteroidota bacterium]
MKVFLFTLFVSLFLGVGLYSAIWYTQNYLEPESDDPFANSEQVGHLENLFAEKVSDSDTEKPENKQEEEVDNWGWEESDAGSSPSIVENIIGEQPKETAKKKSPEKPKGTARGKLDQSTYDFGSIDEGEIIKHNFRILNKGNAPLKIVDVEVGCGCTMVDVPRKAVQAGKMVNIKAVFDSKDKIGLQNKRIRLKTNGSPRYLDMYFKGVVYPKNFGKEEKKEESKEKVAVVQDSVKKQ